MSKFIRKRALQVLKLILDQKPIVDDDGIGGGMILTATNKHIDPENSSIKLPAIAITPAAHTVKVGLLGTFMDSTYRIGIQGFVGKQENQDLFEASEDVIEFITHQLTLLSNVNMMLGQNMGEFQYCKFSIIEMGPILNEQFDRDGNIAYISLPLSIQFVE